MNKKTWILIGVAAVAVCLAAFAAKKSFLSDGDTQSSVSEFAKSIDQTKANTPSVPQEQLALGRSGGMKGRAR